MAVSSHEKKEGLADFCILGGASHNRLSDVERLTLIGGDDLIKILNRVSRDSDPLQFSSIIENLDVDLLKAAAEYYSDDNLGDLPKTFFKTPAGIISPKITPIHGLADGEISDIEFESVYTGHHSSFQKIADAIPENRTVHARYWKHTHGSATTIVAVHGWSMGDQRTNSLAFLPGLFYRLGFDIVLLELPFHGRRLTPEFREIGHSLFPSSNPILTNEAIGQAISDLRQLKLILKALGTKQIGSIGVSLGAYITSLWATLDTLHFAIPMVPLASFSGMAWKVLRQSNPELANLIGPDLVESVYKVHSPLRYAPKTTGDRVLVVAGHGDSVIPQDQPESLQRHFQSRDVVWFSGKHDLSGDRDVVFGAIHSFLAGLGLMAD